MFMQINSGGIKAVKGYIVSVEADVSDGLPGFSISGQLSSEVKEAQERVRTALKNSGFRLYAKKITVNLSPAGIRKGGTAFDLPIAIAILGAFGMIKGEQLKDSMVIGELGLDGTVKPVNGILPLVDAARKEGIKRCFLPAENQREGMEIKGVTCIGVESLRHMTSVLADSETGFTVGTNADFCQKKEQETSPDLDFCDINGQLVLRRAAEIGAAGMHGLLLSGRAGTGKTMVARRIPGILPAPSREEIIEISMVYSVCGLLPQGNSLVSERPFRSPHHTITPQGLVGGGLIPRPGELSLASGGVLFLDELPLFYKQSIEALRQPLEDRRAVVVRTTGSYSFPADFMLVAAMNPCPCGFYPDRNKCNCSEKQIHSYLSRISRPILDRFDLCAEASPVTFKELEAGKEINEGSKAIRARVEKARNIQKKRFAGTKIRFNSQMGLKEIKEYCELDQKGRKFAAQVYDTRQLSARGYHKVLKTARTIADLAGEERIGKSHLAEAFGYRRLEETLW